jgi:hypothetical protein
VLALVAVAGVRAVAAGLRGDGHRVDVARRPRQLDGFLRAGGRAVAGAREDVEALGSGAVVEFVEGFGGLGAESGREVGWLVCWGCFWLGWGRGGLKCMNDVPSESFLVWADSCRFHNAPLLGGCGWLKVGRFTVCGCMLCGFEKLGLVHRGIGGIVGVLALSARYRSGGCQCCGQCCRSCPRGGTGIRTHC